MGKKMSSEERARRALDRDRRALEDFAKGMVPTLLGKAVIALRDASVPITSQTLIEHLLAEQEDKQESRADSDLSAFLDLPYQFAIDQLKVPASGIQGVGSDTLEMGDSA
ncbi:hypothetical protein [Lysobacter sp. yr284]|uniref:hypothetical protein n=1 Tax=Lysobacter sp. yr284 TaxID=1761791 RepID=UPI00111330AA|nr:hypothetical protein [Lysobacter sp. yr284]